MRINRLINFSIICLIIFALASIAGCGKKVPPAPENVMNNEFKGAPDWVVKGCNGYWKPDEAKKMICGVGSVGGTRNPALAREAAIGRARADLARKIQVSLNSMLKDYQATTTGGANYGTDAADEQHIESITKQITSMNLSGTELIDSWISENGTYYVLIALDAEKFKDSINKMGNLNENLRKAIVERADKAFEELNTVIKEKNQ
jgi:hypothetical protein